LSRFNPASERVGVAVPTTAMFMSVFYIMGHVGCYAGGLPELCHKCVTYAQ